jgi:signal transduction histidine kinase
MSADRSSLVSRLAASTALLAATVVLLAVIFFQAIHGNFFMGAFQTPLKEWSTFVAGRIGDDKDIARAVAKNHQIGVIISIKDGRFAYGPDGEAADPDELLSESADLRQIDVTGHGPQRYSFLLNKQQFASDHGRLLAALIILLLITIGLVYVIQLSLLRPLKWLRSGVDAVSRGDFSTRVPVVRNDEIGQVARSFNLMTRRVEQMMDDRERLLADVSHELRSPLARMKVALELLPAGEKNDSIAQDIRSMESLITALLEREQVRARISQDEAGQDESATINLVAVAGEVIDGFGDTAPGIELNVPPRTIEIRGDGALIKVLIQNLVDNAVKFSQPDSKPVELSLLVDNAVKFSLPDSKPVELSLGQTDDEIQIIVDDDGPGIPGHKAEEVLEPFVKLNPARGHRAGYGLGLNLCQRIVQAQGGTIEISQREKRGTRVLVVLPKNRATPEIE